MEKGYACYRCGIMNSYPFPRDTCERCGESPAWHCEDCCPVHGTQVALGGAPQYSFFGVAKKGIESPFFLLVLCVYLYRPLCCAVLCAVLSSASCCPLCSTVLCVVLSCVQYCPLRCAVVRCPCVVLSSAPCCAVFVLRGGALPARRRDRTAQPRGSAAQHKSVTCEISSAGFRFAP